MMDKNQELLPKFARSVASSLRSLGHTDLADELSDLEITRWTHDPDADALYLYLAGQRTLNFVERNIIGARHQESICLDDLDGMVVVDMDNFNRLTGIEALA